MRLLDARIRYLKNTTDSPEIPTFLVVVPESSIIGGGGGWKTPTIQLSG